MILPIDNIFRQLRDLYCFIREQVEGLTGNPATKIIGAQKRNLQYILTETLGAFFFLRFVNPCLLFPLKYHCLIPESKILSQSKVSSEYRGTGSRSSEGACPN